jgi:hypothetical protein
LSQINQGIFAPSFEAMAEKMLLEFSAPNINNIRIGPTIDHEFELKPSLINMVQADLFSGKVHEDASAHLQNFLEKGATISIKDIPKETILLCLFPFLLRYGTSGPKPCSSSSLGQNRSLSASNDRTIIGVFRGWHSFILNFSSTLFV